MQVCTLLQTDNHASTPPLSFLQAGCPSCRSTNSVKALKASNATRVFILVNSCVNVSNNCSSTTPVANYYTLLGTWVGVFGGVVDSECSQEWACISGRRVHLSNTAATDVKQRYDITARHPQHFPAVRLQRRHSAHNHTQQQRMSMLSVRKNYWHWFGLQTGIR